MKTQLPACHGGDRPGVKREIGMPNDQSCQIVLHDLTHAGFQYDNDHAGRTIRQLQR